MVLKNKIANLENPKKLSVYNFALFLLVPLLAFCIDFIPNEFITRQISLFCGLIMVGVAAMSLYNSIRLTLRKRKHGINTLWILFSAIPFILFFGVFVFEMQQELFLISQH